MTTYTVLPQDDSQFDVTITDTDAVTITLQPVTISSSGGIISVNGLTGAPSGAVVLDTDDIGEGTTNLYYTDARVDAWLQGGGVTSINFENATSLSWNADDGTLEFPVNGEVTLQVGQEQLIHVKNLSGTSLTNGTVVYVTGASGSKITVDRADSSNEFSSATTIAVMTQDLNDNAVGYATTQGLVRGLNTSAYAEGSALYLNSNGAFSTTKPITPDHLVPIGWVVRSHATEGSIYVHINNGQELDELHDVLITNNTDGELISWDGVNGYWKNQTLDELDIATKTYVDSQAHFDGQYSSLTGAPTVVSAFTNDAGYITDYTVTQADVTQHQAALTITESQISDLQHTTVPTNVSAFVNDAGYLTSETDSQTLSFTNPNLSISNGNSVNLGTLELNWTNIFSTPTTLAGYGIDDAFSGSYNDLTDKPDLTNIVLGSNSFYAITSDYNTGPYDLSTTGRYIPIDLSPLGGIIGTNNWFMAHTWGTSNEYPIGRIVAIGSTDDGSHNSAMVLQGNDRNYIKSLDSSYNNKPLDIETDKLKVPETNFVVNTSASSGGVLPIKLIRNNTDGGSVINDDSKVDMSFAIADGNTDYDGGNVKFIGGLSAVYDTTNGNSFRLYVDPNQEASNPGSNSHEMQVHEDFFQISRPMVFASYVYSTVPNAADHNGHVIRVIDGDAGNPCLAMSDGTNWKVIATLGNNISPT